MCGDGLFAWLTCYQLLRHLGVTRPMAGQARLEGPNKLSSYKTPSRLQLCRRCEAIGLSSPSPKEVPSQRRAVGTHHLSMPGAARTAVCELAAPAASSADVAVPRAMLSPHPVSPSFGEMFPPSSWPGIAASCLRESGALAQPVLTFRKHWQLLTAPPVGHGCRNIFSNKVCNL